uniref:NADH dehydrogenase [ubiquinone] 1 alpha subcomplex subunit 12 n=1 Tax=Elaeis guineensis var. tenera TaxID=51953 RepID=A0A6J0PC94_ELAGV|nr:NADH dehydrogenase [ubiquinone] 1 alpha subcomplex subunit 12 isoform X16 [Elaeis guineensis]
MSKILSKLRGFFSSRTMVGVDKAGNRYFTRKEEIDGAMKEKRWVVFKGEEDPTSIPVEWICWLNGQRKKAPTPEEMIELEARREHVRQNVACKGGSLDLKSFIQQFPSASFDHNRGFEEVSDEIDGTKNKDRSSEPTGSGESFKPGTWQPPT